MRKITLALWAAIILQIVLTFCYSLTRLYTNKTSLLDLGVFRQMLFNFQASGIPTSTINAPYESINFLGFHFSPILLLLTPLVNAPIWSLLLVQSVVVAITAVPVFLCIRKILGNEKPALVWALIYLVCPLSMNAAVFDFHEQCLAVLFFAFAYWFLLDKKFFAFISCCFALLLFKEQFGAAVFGFGILWRRQHNDKRGLAVAALGLIAGIVIIAVVMPELSGHAHSMAHQGSPQDRYSWLVSGDLQTLSKLVQLTDNSAIMYPIVLLFLYLFLPTFSPIWLLPALGDFMANVLSSNSMPRSIYSYHSITIIICLIIASCMTLKKIPPGYRYQPLPISLLILISTLAAIYSTGPFTFNANNLWRVDKYVFAQDKDVEEIRKLVGSDSILSVQNNVGAFFADRKLIYPFPEKTDNAQYIIINSKAPYEAGHHPFGNPYEPEKYFSGIGKFEQGQKLQHRFSS